VLFFPGFPCVSHRALDEGVLRVLGKEQHDFAAAAVSASCSVSPTNKTSCGPRGFDDTGVDKLYQLSSPERRFCHYACSRAILHRGIANAFDLTYTL